MVCQKHIHQKVFQIHLEDVQIFGKEQFCIHVLVYIDSVVGRDPCIPSDLGEGRGGVQSCTYLAVVKITMSEIKL